MMSDIKTFEALASRGVLSASDFPDRDGSSTAPGTGCVIEDSSGHKHRLFSSSDSFAKAYAPPEAPNPLGSFICAKVSPSYRAPEELRREFAALDTSSGASVLPESFYAGTIDAARNQSRVLQAGAQTLNMTTPEVRLGRRENVVSPEVKQENELFTAQTMTFGYILLRSYFIGSYYEFSREFVEDSADAPAEIERMIRADLAVGIDNFALNGTGSNEPVGLMHTPGIVGATGGAVSWSKYATAASAIRGDNYEPSAVILNPAINDALRDSKDSQLRWLDAPPSLRGVNYLATNQAASTDSVIGDFSQMIWGVRAGLEIESTQTGGDSFQRHQVLVKVYWRGDFGVRQPSAFRKFTDLTVS